MDLILQKLNTVNYLNISDKTVALTIKKYALLAGLDKYKIRWS